MGTSKVKWFSWQAIFLCLIGSQGDAKAEILILLSLLVFDALGLIVLCGTVENMA